MITTVLFDYGRVLAYPRTGSWFITPETHKITGNEIFSSILTRQAEAGAAFQKAHAYLNENHFLHTEAEEIEQFTRFYSMFFIYMGISVSDGTCNELATDIVCNDDKVAFYDDVYGVLSELKKEYKIGILSDTWPSLRRILNNSGILPFLDVLIMSCDHNETKEGTKLFDIAVKEINESPVNILFIDDSLSNLLNAQKAGLIPILMDRDDQYKTAEYPIVKNLYDVRVVSY